ncbi:MAG: hypothetical protein LBU73_00110 [Helicobacteraceae bacterium]|jgi:hypothetical protein|nr:hypothetical protein [Helicobacteraceae bacterium]
MEANVDLEEQRATIEAFFMSQSTFESELFGVSGPSEMYEVMVGLAKSVIDRPTAQNTVNFKTLETYAKFRIEGCVLALKELINEQIDYLLSEEAGFDPIVMQELRADKEKQTFILQQSKRYFLEYHKLFKEAIADTYFERIVMATDMKLVDKVAQEVIDGIGNLAPVFMQPNGASIVRRADQIWMRLRQAKIAKEKDIKVAKENVDRLSAKAKGLEKNIQAIEQAKKITMEQVTGMAMDELREIVINEDGSRTELKRVFQFIPAGDVSLYLADQMDRGRRGGRNEIQKGDYKRAQTFYENCNINNTPKELKNKLDMFTAELPKVQVNLDAALKKHKEIEARGLHAYDDALAKIRAAFLENIAKSRL